MIYDTKIMINKEVIEMIVTRKIGFDPMIDRRLDDVVRSRFIAFYMMRKYIPSLSLTNIANKFGRKSHATVINGLNQVEWDIEKIKGFKDIIDDISLEIERYR